MFSTRLLHALAIGSLLLANGKALAATMDTSEKLERIGIELKLLDISEHKNKEAIIYLYKQGVVSGYPDSTFRPDDTVNRAELLKLLIGDKTASLDVIDEWGKPRAEYRDCFSDVHDEWFAASVCFGKKQGWITGYPDGSFRPAQPVIKAEAIKMLVAVGGFPLAASGDTTFGDMETGAWYTPYVESAATRKLLEENDRTSFGKPILGVNSAMTRGGVAEMVYRVAMMESLETDTYTRSNELPWLMQVTKGNLLPINLVNNQKWSIHVELKEDSFLDVQRDEDSFTVRRYYIDPHTGKETNYALDPYSAQFSERLNGTYLLARECHWRYPALRLEAVCDEYNIPASITQSVVHGNTGLIDREGADWKVTLLSKAKEEIPCDVRGEKYQGEKVYYSPESKAKSSGVFKCFETEEAAIRAGYKKSYK